MDSYLAPLAFTVAAIGAGLARRWRVYRQHALETARHVEAERIIAMLSAKQPGVWDQEDLRSRMREIAERLWSAPTRDALAQLEPWVSAQVLAQALHDWPARSVRREVALEFAPVAFMQVHEGGPQNDRVVARLIVRRDSSWLDAEDHVLRRRREGARTTYHTWLHVDGRGWHLEAIAPSPPNAELPPYSVSCRILPQSPERAERSG
ncbi:MAG TPA: hypothetical protein V6D47_04290 [Oscillatoriaceae cyanobacterium]